jgi:hypothetical protein
MDIQGKLESGYKERASTRNVGAVFNREIYYRGCKPLPQNFILVVCRYSNRLIGIRWKAHLYS